MTTYLIVYKYNIGINFYNILYLCEEAPVLSEIQLQIMQKHKWNIDEFSIINIIPVKNELKHNIK